MLENELWGNTIENWGISILIILGAIIIVKLLSLLRKLSNLLLREPTITWTTSFFTLWKRLLSLL